MTAPTATIHDVAQLAGVSVSTVSRVLSGASRVSDPKRAAVLAAVRTLGFTPNSAARALATRQSRCIGVLVQLIGDPYVGDFLYGVNRGLRGSGYQAIIAAGDWDETQEARAVRHLLAQPVEALIVQDGALPDAALERLAGRLPLVTVGRGPAGERSTRISIDQAAAAYSAVRHLLALGHRRVAHLAGPANQPHARQRRAGYLRALREAGLPADPALIVEGDFQKRVGIRNVQTLLARGVPFTAVFAANDELAFGALFALHHSGLRVPEDVSVLGFDDLRLAFAEVCFPPLTTVHQPVVEMGAAAARAALARIRGETPPHVTFAAPLAQRGSCAPAPPVHRPEEGGSAGVRRWAL